MWIVSGIVIRALGAVPAPSAHPVPPRSPAWAGVMLIIVGGIFLMAVAVGLAVRYNAPEEVPHTHAHDEPPGASHHHGPSGDQP